MADIQGNRNVTNDLLRAFLALQQASLRKCNVAEVAIVTGTLLDNGLTIYRCSTMGVDILLDCVKIQNLTIDKGDVVVVLFNNRSYRKNLLNAKANRPLQAQNSDETLHSLSYGIIIGKL